MMEAFSIILVEPQNPINLGTVIRAMKNMGFGRLSLVNPAPMAFEKTQISAHHTEDLLERIEVFKTLDEALQECHESYGFSARVRSQSWATVAVEDAVARMLGVTERGGRVAMVFGREQTGLTNEELERCTFQVHIPTTEYSSLNLAQAVLIAMYEIRRQRQKGEAQAVCQEIENYAPGSLPATLDQQRMLVRAIGDALVNVGYFKSDAPNAAVHRVQNILMRARLHEDEIHLLMGMCREVENYARLLKRGIEPSKFRPKNSLLDGEKGTKGDRA